MIDLIACSICLRVRRSSEWLDAEHVIRDIKSYDDELPRLHGAVCDWRTSSKSTCSPPTSSPRSYADPPASSTSAPAYTAPTRTRIEFVEAFAPRVAVQHHLATRIPINSRVACVQACVQ
jgi:hypothetical protein